MGAPKGSPKGGKGKGLGKGTKGKGKGSVSSKGKGSESKGVGKGKPVGKGVGKGKAVGKGSTSQWVPVKPTVLVTGASGYVAQHVIQALLELKYRVKGTVRNPDDEAKVGPLKKLFPKLELCKADLLDASSENFEKAMEGCKYVMHTASPFIASAVSNPQTELIDPALKGTTIVMEAAVKAKIARVVLTSSAAAVGPPQAWMADPASADKEKVLTEEDWNTDSTLEKGPYRLSKTLAEKKGWEIAKASDGVTSMSAINPTFVIGPMMTDRVDGESVKMIKAMLDGSMKKDGAGGFPMGVVDVRDIAQAHIAAMESDEAQGKRFLVCSEKGYTRIELANMLRDRFKAYDLPTEGPEAVYVPKYDPSSAKKILKFRPRKIEATLRDMANAAIRLGIVEKKVYLKPVEFGKITDIDPESKGLNLLVKVVSHGKEEELKSGRKVQEVVVGDASGVVTLSLSEDEVAAVPVGSTVEVRNAATKMVKGFVRIVVGKWGKVTAHEGGEEISPKTDKDVSATEYELTN